MKTHVRHLFGPRLPIGLAIGAFILLFGCATDPDDPSGIALPIRGPFTTSVISCADIASTFHFASTRILSASPVAAGTLRLPGISEPMPAHCVVTGVMNERQSPVDGKSYAIGFEMRLPLPWNGRYFYQTNGGLDGILVPAYGDILGGGATTNGLLKGFAVISSDGGHRIERDVPGIGAALFGIDPEARRDYGYGAVAQLAPMGRALIHDYYGLKPSWSYLVGTSNGGRMGMVTASRFFGQFDGIVAGTPGINLPRAALAQIWDAQQFAKLSAIDPATQRPDLTTSLSADDFQVLRQAILERCDGLDGLKDGIISDPIACQRVFHIESDVLRCTESVKTQCMSGEKKRVLATVFAGPFDARGAPIYAGMPWDAGIGSSDWRNWKFVYNVGPRDTVALAYVFQTPPASRAAVGGTGTSLIDFALGFDIVRNAGTIEATDPTYTESAMDTMAMPDPLMRKYFARGGKLLIYQGASDPVFSVLDTVNWYQNLRANYGSSIDQRARLFIVPGMNHSRNGPSTDQFDAVEKIMAWAERGEAPDSIVATARGPGANVVNPEIPSNWSAHRTRLLCPFPRVARYAGKGDGEVAASFHCVDPT